MLFEIHNYITLFAFINKFVIYKYFLKNKYYPISYKVFVSFHIIKLFYNYFLVAFGLFGILNHFTNYCADMIILIHKSNQLFNIVSELPGIYSYFFRLNNNLTLDSKPLMFLHHLLLFSLVYSINLNNFETPGVNPQYLLCLYAGVSELSSIFLSLLHIINKHPYIKSNNNYILNNVESSLKILFCISFLSIRVVWWSFYTPVAVYRSYLAFGYTDTSIVFISFQAMQYYWGYLIVKKLKKALTNN